MRAAKRIHLYALKQSTVGHTAVGLWRHPKSQAARYKDLDYWIDTARTLEEGRFDALFIADALGVLDVYAGSAQETLRHGVQTPTNDPLLSISAMAAATSRLGGADPPSWARRRPSPTRWSDGSRRATLTASTFSTRCRS